MTVALAVTACSSDPEPIARARDIVDDDRGFGTSTEAGESFAHVAELVLDAGYRETSAWLQVLAVEVLDCRQPDVYDARQDVLRQLADPTRPLPALPRCE